MSAVNVNAITTDKEVTSWFNGKMVLIQLACAYRRWKLALAKTIEDYVSGAARLHMTIDHRAR